MTSVKRLFDPQRDHDEQVETHWSTVFKTGLRHFNDVYVITLVVILKQPRITWKESAKEKFSVS